jgi:hypothetical protein
MLALLTGGKHGFGSQVPAGALNEPAKQLRCREAEAVYPLLQKGVHEEPLGVDTKHDEKRVEAVLDGTMQGSGLHAPINEVRLPLMQVRVSEALAV